MPSFSCETCGDVLKRAQIPRHRHPFFSCLDCSQVFDQTSYLPHTSCISEAEKYQGKLFKGDKKQKAASEPANKEKQEQTPEPPKSLAPLESSKKRPRSPSIPQPPTLSWLSDYLSRHPGRSLARCRRSFLGDFPSLSFEDFLASHGKRLSIALREEK